MDTAIHFEGIKHHLRQSKDGIVVSFVVHPHEVPEGLMTSAIGARYIMALVEIGDDEQPKEAMRNHNGTKRSDAPNNAGPRQAKSRDGAKAWSDVTPAAQAGIRCGEPIFQAFLAETWPALWREYNEDAAEFVRGHCIVKSRSELSTNHKARILWRDLDAQFQAWKAMEHAS